MGSCTLSFNNYGGTNRQYSCGVDHVGYAVVKPDESYLGIVPYADLGEAGLSGASIDALAGSAAFDLATTGNTPGTSGGQGFSGNDSLSFPGYTYLQDAIGIADATPQFYGDLYRTLIFEFSHPALPAGAYGSFVFIRTVALGDVAPEVPEPATALLVLPVLAFIARKKFLARRNA